MHWWAAEYFEKGQYWILYLFAMWVVISICLHELAHGWAALQQGDTTPRDLGRMTFNPMVHMGGFAFLAFILMGITWGQMPVDPTRFKWGRWGDVWVSAAGPLMNLALALVLYTALGVLIATSGDSGAALDPTSPRARVIEACLVGASLNGALLAFNLLPVPPLDGATIVAGLSRTTYRFYHSEPVRRFGIFGLFIVFLSPIGDVVMGAADVVGARYTAQVIALVQRFQ